MKMFRCRRSETLASVSSRKTPISASAATVVVFTTATCKHCKRAKAALTANGIIYEEIQLQERLELLKRVKELTGRQTVPQVFIGGKLVGGADDVEALLASGELDTLLASAVGIDPLPEVLQAALHEALAEEAAGAERALMDALAGEASSAPAEDREELDKLSTLVKQMRAEDGLEILDHYGCRSGFPWEKEPRCFSGADCVAWLVQAAAAPDAAAAVALGRRMQALRLLKHVSCSAAFTDCEATFFRFQQDDPAAALNMLQVWRGSTRPGPQVADSLRRQIEGLYSQHLSDDGRQLDYDALGQSEAFADFVTATGELQRVDLFQMSREELIAFYINVYNMLVIHATVVRGPPQNTAERLSFFSSIRYRIGGHDYTTDEIENGVLRGNRASAADPFILLGMPQFGRPTFPPGDPRLYHSVNPMDPRIHCALVCGAKSCPPIRVYSAASLDVGLDGATEAFCESEVKVDTESRTVTLSKIFKWYSVDFGTNQSEILQWTLPYLADDKAATLKAMLEDEASGGGAITVAYSEYDWGLNSK
eukprot:CAMPEP_0118922860 /NCGR_PEP_ID=MMETSP1169-20130426/1626_1 /TAXON_ID=36882 /ORGANISM="Pyramimonas obovata, Strain CCMP722" /LENGTH=537 /DNA_ID=CAMNT_0006863787 /DNA_START=279 /DNA_END=1892 /DNA_ORIENTATION=+